MTTATRGAARRDLAATPLHASSELLVCDRRHFFAGSERLEENHLFPVPLTHT
jgi:hypothetical protein